MTIYDVVIVGNGIVGQSIAFALAVKDPGLAVAVAGPAGRGGGASAAAGAMLNSFAEVTTTTFRTEATRARFLMNRVAAQRWPGHLELLNSYLAPAERAASADGTYVVLNGRSGGVDEQNFACVIDALCAAAEPHEIVDPAQVPGIAPVPDHRPLRALWIPNEGAVDSRRVLRGLELAAQAIGNVAAVDSEVVRLKAAGGSISAVLLANGEYLYADRFVLAAGASCQALLDELADCALQLPPTLAGRGVAFTTSSPDPALRSVIRTPTRSGGCGLHAVPQADGSLYLGATNEVSVLPRRVAGIGSAHTLLDNAFNQLHQDLGDADIHQWHVGNRPVSLDTFPLIGPTTWPNLWLVTGTYRDGFHCSPLLGEHIARLVTSEPGLPEVNDLFQPVRPLIDTLTPKEAIVEAARQMTSGSYEHHVSLPAFLSSEDLYDLFLRRTEEIYQQLDTNFGLAPEFIDMCLTFGSPAIEWLRRQLAARNRATAF